MWITVTPLIYKFNSYCEVRYGSAVRHMPLETAAAAPAASIPAVVYMPPALRKGAAGWYPEFGKARSFFSPEHQFSIAPGPGDEHLGFIILCWAAVLAIASPAFVPAQAISIMA